ncbi:hypothetical protein P3T76_001804 [Phytophthora citrophthora]|uniref:Uncharacterized protein n=1 Tax=Phytophthora citrophthora TaxID=4793 RepID=A0AAD9LRT4_9STRA|nr:hypothetical protein P3T76_001804 [Phytophthora citrophthora]
MTFHLVLKYKKNVLVYRCMSQSDCCFYLGYEDGKVVYFTVEGCNPEQVMVTYEELKSRQGFLQRAAVTGQT